MSQFADALVVRLALRALRTGMLTRSADLIGPGRLATALSIEPRSLRAKLSTDRSISDADLHCAAEALDRLATAAAAQARAIRDILPDTAETGQ